jgi:hypothetical protein
VGLPALEPVQSLVSGLQKIGASKVLLAGAGENKQYIKKI